MAGPASQLDRALDVLSAVAAEPRLGGVLFLDLDPSLLQPLADWLADYMAALGVGIRPPVHVVGSNASDELLWMRTLPGPAGLSIVPGVLVEEPPAPPPVIVVPDLCRASGATARAAIATVGADYASAERLSLSYRWRPRARWLAAADRAEARGLSAHLLDRFPLRVAADDIEGPEPDDSGMTADAPFADWPPRRPAPGPEAVPPLSEAAVDRLVTVVRSGPSRRRDLAIARLARVVAGRAGALAVAPAHVDDALALLGITPPAAAPDPPPDPPQPDQPDRRVPADDHADNGGRPPVDPRTAMAVAPGEQTVLDPVETTFPPGEADPDPFEDWPFLEDHPEAIAPHASLLDIGFGRPRVRRSHRPPAGTRPASDLEDIAAVATVLQAALFQRTRGWTADGRLVIWPSDLRKYRRLPSPGAVLVLVLDHSCWPGGELAAAIAPYLYRAYQRSAAVSVVEFGYQGTGPELRAVSYRTRSVLNPRVTDSLDRAAGRASPLAHALDLAVQEVRTHLRAMPDDRAVLLVATDGRGNVPLSASLLNRMPQEDVGRSGVTDALTAAVAVKAMSGVEAVVVTPDVDQYAALPFDLAAAMGGAVIVAATAEKPEAGS